MGDFNEIVRAEEKTGGAPRKEGQMTGFRVALDFCGLRDLGYVGSLVLGVIINLMVWLRGSG